MNNTECSRTGGGPEQGGSTYCGTTLAVGGMFLISANKVV